MACHMSSAKRKSKVESESDMLAKMAWLPSPGAERVERHLVVCDEIETASTERGFKRTLQLMMIDFRGLPGRHLEGAVGRQREVLLQGSRARRCGPSPSRPHVVEGALLPAPAPAPALHEAHARLELRI